MAETAREMVWLHSFLEYLGNLSPFPMSMHCDNQAIIFIAGKSTFHEHAMHIDIDCHYIPDKVI